MKQSSIRIMLAVAALAALVTVSCSKEDRLPPVITGVRVPDPAYADSLFTQASTWQMIAVLGEHLSNAKNLYINGQDVFFNATMNTDHSIIVTIPSEEDGFELTVWNKDLPDEIRVVTPYGEASYSFKVLAPAASITSFKGETYPLTTGEAMTVIGNNFLDVQRIFFTDQELSGMTESDIRGLNGTEVAYELSLDRQLDPKSKTYVTASVMTFGMPSLNYDKGYFVLQTVQNVSYVRFSKLPPPELFRISSQMPVKGETVTLTGDYFIGVDYVAVGDVILTGEDLTVASDGLSLSFRMPEPPAATVSTLSVSAVGGISTMEFYDKSTLLLDFDTLGANQGWDPSCAYPAEADGTVAPFSSSGSYAWFNCNSGAWNWWGTMLYWRAFDEGEDDCEPFPLPDYPDNTPASKLSFSFEAYNAASWNYSFLNYYFQCLGGEEFGMDAVGWDWDAGAPTGKTLVNDDGEEILGRWFEVNISLDKFGFTTYGDFKAKKVNRIRIMQYDWGGNTEDLLFGIDNIRIQKNQ